MRRRLELGLLLAVLLAMPALLQAAQTPEATLGAALHQERVIGNLQAAIDGYRKIVAGKGVSRSLAAQAQYHIGVCYEKLGNQEARKAFENVLRNYSDQKDVAIRARARLVAMGGLASSKGPHTTLLWDNARDYDGTASADGRYLSFVDRNTGDVAIKDLLSGEERRVTNKGGFAKSEGTTETTAISPDGKRVAFVWDAWDAAAVKDKTYFQLRVIRADGTGERTLRSAAGYIDVSSWSPDGRWIAASVPIGLERDAPVRMILFSPDSGEERILHTSGQRHKARIRFSPDGAWLAYDEKVRAGQPAALYLLPADGSAASETELAKTGQMMGWALNGKSILFSRERGNESSLFILPVTDGKAAGEALPLYTASNMGWPFGVTAEGKLLYGLDNLHSDAWLGEIDVESGRLGQTAAQFSADKARVWMVDAALKFSPDGKQVLWTESSNRVFIRSTAGDRQLTVTTQMKETWRVEWAHDSRALLIAGIDTDGREGLYRVDPASGAATFLTAEVGLGPQGFVAFVPSRDGKTIYHRTAHGKLAALSLDSGAERILHEDFKKVPNLSLSHDGKKLAVRSGGYLATLDLASGQLKALYTRDFATDSNVMWGLDWSADDRKVLVIARNNRTEKCALWIFPADGGQSIREPLPVEMLGLSLSPDGKLAATVRVEKHRQVWALENFLPGK
jgi:Tol biopolymer transport system component